MSVLVVVAHPDDETIGAGGTIAMLRDRGEDIHFAVLGESRAPKENLHNAIVVLLGEHWLSTTVDLLNLPDQKFDTVPAVEITQSVETLVAEYNPDTVYTHHPGDLNLDHVITARAVLTACRPVNDCPVRTIYAMEIPSSTEWGDGSFQPTTYVDISATIERKIEAMEMYETERRAWPHPRSPAALRALAMTRGAASGLEAAEAFQVLREIRR